MKTFFRNSLICFIPLIPLWVVAGVVLKNPIQISGYLAYVYLILVLLVSPTSYVLSKVSYTKKFSNRAVALRRPVGVIAGLLTLWHASMYLGKTRDFWQVYVEGDIGYFSFLWQAIGGSSGFILGMDAVAFWVGLVGFIVMMILLFTSNDLSQRIIGMRVWKYVQRFVYPLFLLAIVHIYFVGGWKGLYLYPAIILIVVRLWSWFDKNFVYRGRIQITHSRYRRFLCRPCGYIYDEELGDPDGGLPPGTRYEEIPDDWICPVCGAAKKDFVALDGHFNPQLPDDHKHIVCIASKEMLTGDVIRLVISTDRELDIKPGQYCNLVFQVDDESWSRSYSVAKYIDGQIHFLIKLKEGGLGSTNIQSLEVGDKIEILGPFGDFALQNTMKRKIFVATGTGISPIYMMMCAAWDCEKELHFSVRTHKDLFFLDELGHIPNLTIYTYITQEEASGSVHGRVSVEHIRAKHDDEIYLCGNPNMIAEFSKTLEDRGYMHVYSEKFV